MEFTCVYHINVPCQKSIVERKALSYAGPSLWNNLNKILKTSLNLNAFKRNIKQH